MLLRLLASDLALKTFNRYSPRVTANRQLVRSRKVAAADDPGVDHRGIGTMPLAAVIEQVLTALSAIPDRNLPGPNTLSVDATVDGQCQLV